METDQIIRDALGEKYLADFHETNLGWVSARNDDVYVGARFLNKFNKPTPEDEIEYLSQFSEQTDWAALQSFYRTCNGFRLMSDFFASPGIPYYQLALDELDYFNIPVDVKLTAGIDFPKYAPFRGFVIGERHKPFLQETRNLISILAEDGKVLSGYFREAPEVVSTHADITEWLGASVRGAVADFEQYWASKD